MKKVIIILGIFLICLLLCIGSCFGIFILLFSKLWEDGQEIKQDILLDVCNSHGEISNFQYGKWFTEDFKEKNSIVEAESYVKQAFPKNYNCDKLLEGNILSLFKNKQQLNIKWENGISTSQISYLINTKKRATIYLLKNKANWQIDLIVLSNY